MARDGAASSAQHHQLTCLAARLLLLGVPGLYSRWWQTFIMFNQNLISFFPYFVCMGRISSGPGSFGLQGFTMTLLLSRRQQKSLQHVLQQFPISFPIVFRVVKDRGSNRRPVRPYMSHFWGWPVSKCPYFRRPPPISREEKIHPLEVQLQIRLKTHA